MGIELLMAIAMLLYLGILAYALRVKRKWGENPKRIFKKRR